jgi:hypothetical protein
MKNLTLLTLACSLALLTACDNRDTSMLNDLNKSLDVASNTMNSFEDSGSDVTQDNAMDVFSKNYASNLNSEQSLNHLGPMGVQTENDGSFTAYADTNSNQVKDADEKGIFKLEADAENNRLVASTDSEVAQQPHMGMGSGFLMGMLMSNMLGRQRATGTNPASRRATKRSSAAKKTPSAKSRAGSGSHSSGK